MFEFNSFKFWYPIIFMLVMVITLVFTIKYTAEASAYRYDITIEDGTTYFGCTNVRSDRGVVRFNHAGRAYCCKYTTIVDSEDQSK